MLQLILETIIQGCFSAIGIGVLFYFYLVMNHICFESYRFKFKLEDNSIIIFQLVTLMYLRIDLIYRFDYISVLGTILVQYGGL
jgi:hypothetical protein